MHDADPAAVLDRLLSDPASEFALLYRPDSGGRDVLEVLVGDVREETSLADVVPTGQGGAPEDGPRADVLVVLPFRQVVERGFACHDDGEPVLALDVAEHWRVGLAAAVDAIADVVIPVQDVRFEPDDAAYAAIVRDVLQDEIGRGEGANFVVRRDLRASVPGFSVPQALALFRRLLLRERGAYWIFLVRTESQTFVGATPERHVSLDEGLAVMNPISGTHRLSPSGSHRDDVLEFLGDRKENDELFMVVDEELKMMAAVCAQGGRVRGPYLKEMARLVHTEYLIEGRSTVGVGELLRSTMFAPTVTGSPLENACRVIARHESGGRGYYSGVLALIGRGPTGDRTLDSAIVLRTAVVDAAGALRMGVGATLVRLSDPDAEVAETHAKAAAMLAALHGEGTPPSREPAGATLELPRQRSESRASLAQDPQVRRALAARNAPLARFWLQDPHGSGTAPADVLRGRRGIVINAGDAFTAMLAQQLTSLGAEVSVVPWHRTPRTEESDFVVVGPGPGDPTDVRDPKIAALRALVRDLLVQRLPLLAVCLGHQALAGVLGLDLVRRQVPHQGAQIPVDLWGARELVGFYNSFVATSSSDRVAPLVAGGPVDVARDQGTGQVHALRGPAFASTQFHPESVLTHDGPAILARLLAPVLAPAPTGGSGRR